MAEFKFEEFRLTMTDETEVRTLHTTIQAAWEDADPTTVGEEAYQHLCRFNEVLGDAITFINTRHIQGEER